MATLIKGHPLIYVLFFMNSSTVLSVGLLSGFGNDIAGRLFYIFLAWLSPILFQFHSVWAPFPKNRLVKGISSFFYLLAFAWSIPFSLKTITELQNLGWFSVLRSGVRITIVLALIGVIVWLIIQNHQSAPATTRYRIRLVFAGSILAFAPLLLLSLVPNLLGAQFIRTDANFAWLLFIPLSYGYSIANPKSPTFERVCGRIIAYYLSIVLFASGYLVIAGVVSFFVPAWSNFWGWAIAGMGMVFLFLLARTSQIARKFSAWVLFGSEKSQMELLIQMTNSLGPVLDREKLRQILVEELSSTVATTGIALFLTGKNNSLELQGQSGFDWPVPCDFSLPIKGALATFLKKQGVITENRKVHQNLNRQGLTPDEAEILAFPDIGLWMPLVSGDAMHGLLILGAKSGGLLFNKGDQQVWLIFAHQAGVAAHNLLLTEDIQASHNELAHAHHRLLYAGEQERRQLACELHDNVVQQLIGISYQMVALQNKAKNSEPEIDILRQEILQVTSQLRGLIGELRPAGLEEFGVGSVLESLVNKMQRRTTSSTPHFEINIEKNTRELPEPIGICLFRVSQEALRNTINHANAQNIRLDLSSTQNEIVLEISDDGKGFRVPDRLSEFALTNHFGLVGIAERVVWVNGHLEIRSQPGQGTKITVRIPGRDR